MTRVTRQARFRTAAKDCDRSRPIRAHHSCPELILSSCLKHEKQVVLQHCDDDNRAMSNWSLKSERRMVDPSGHTSVQCIVEAAIYD